MASTTTILKLGRLDAVTRSVGTGSHTFALSSLLKADETIGTPKVNIHAIQWSTTASGSPITITRGGTQLYNLQGSGSITLDGANDSENNTSDLVIDLGSNGGTLVLFLRKVSGYTEPDQQHPR